MAFCWMSIITLFKGSSPSRAAFTGTFSSSIPEKKGTGFQQLRNLGTDRCRCCSSEKPLLVYCEGLPGLLASKPIVGVDCGWLAKSILGLQAFRSKMCTASVASMFSTLEVRDNSDEDREGAPAPVDADHHQNTFKGVGHGTQVDSDDLRGRGDESGPSKRKFCNRCGKAAILCICHHIKIVVDNKTAITILQHPEEKKHHLGSARIALLALQKVEIISIPEVDQQVSYRMRGKVPGSKRFISGRGGKKAQNLDGGKKNKVSLKSQSDSRLQPSESNSHSEQELMSQNLLNSVSGEGTPLESDSALRGEDCPGTFGDEHQLVQWYAVPSWIKLQPDAGLLFPGEQALDLWPVGLEVTSSSDSGMTFQSDGEQKRVPTNSPSQLIVLDGTWSKAKRIFFENPWLRLLPQYRLPTLQPSRYGGIRREPKPGFLSTIESIVYALQLLEPDTQNLESLLDVFDSMIEDQKRFLAENVESEDVKHGNRSWRDRV